MKNKIFFLGFDIIPQSQDDRNIKINNKENQNDEEDFSFNTMCISL